MYSGQLCLSNRWSLFFIRESYVRSISRHCFIRNYPAIPVQLEVVVLQYIIIIIIILDSHDVSCHSGNKRSAPANILMHLILDLLVILLTDIHVQEVWILNNKTSLNQPLH